MSTKAITTVYYSIDSHPKPVNCFDYIRANWHDLADFAREEIIDSLKALAFVVEGELDYCVSYVPDRGEYIRLENINKDALARLKEDDLPLTGVSYDYAVIQSLRKGNLERTVLDLIHEETKYLYSDEGLEELCLANDYYFTLEGMPYVD